MNPRARRYLRTAIEVAAALFLAADALAPTPIATRLLVAGLVILAGGAATAAIGWKFPEDW